MKYNRRFIEESFPIKEVGAESSGEKYIRAGNIGTLHPWWARRPLSSSRATIYGSLIGWPQKTKDISEKKQFIIEFSKWKNKNNPRMINQARKEILSENSEIPPVVLDPFGGGGAIPLEALRLGCETYSSDLNPVAVLIQKCLLEYPFINEFYKPDSEDELHSPNNIIIDEIERWAMWIYDKVKAEIDEFYPSTKEGLTVIGYRWAHSIPCQNPNCNAEIPLFKNLWLVKKKDRKIALNPVNLENRIEFEIVGNSYNKWSKKFDPELGTVSRAVVTCLVCKSTIDAKTTRNLFKSGKNDQILLATILKDSSKKGKIYRIPNEDDFTAYRKCALSIKNLKQHFNSKWGMNPIPDEPTPEGRGSGAERAFSLRNYGLDTWGDLFNERQKFALVSFTNAVREAYECILVEGYSEEQAIVITSYLGILVSRLTNRMSKLAYWYIQGEKTQPTFVRPALGMVWDYMEINPFNDSSGGWFSNLRDVISVMKHLVEIRPQKSAIVKQNSATNLPYQDNFFDAVFTDPPYYDNVPYSYLSDFFYVWLKRSIGFIHPNLFSTPLTPKTKEIVAYSNGPMGFEGGKAFFEENLSQSFKEIHRVLKPNGVALIVYAHKSTAGWETLINSLLDSQLIVTGAWPINTELRTRLRAKESASLASSIYIITRKAERKETGLYREVKKEIEKYLETKLENLWEHNIGGADFFIAAIGSAIEVFGKYREVIDYEGKIVRAELLLNDVRRISTNFTINQILHNGFSEQLSPVTRFYILYRWNYKTAVVKFDEARKLAQSCGIDLAEHWSGSGFIRKRKEFIKVVGPKGRRIEDVKDSILFIDILHYVVLLWEKGRKDEISKILYDKKLKNSEMFWRVAQAISETLPTQNKEKKLLDGFLAGRTGYQSEDRYEQETLE